MKRLFFAEVGSPGLGRLFLSCVVVLGIYGGGEYKNHTNDNGPSKISDLQLPLCAYPVRFELSQIRSTPSLSETPVLSTPSTIRQHSFIGIIHALGPSTLDPRWRPTIKERKNNQRTQQKQHPSISSRLVRISTSILQKWQ
jgi:hypothetical protein